MDRWWKSSRVEAERERLSSLLLHLDAKKRKQPTTYENSFRGHTHIHAGSLLVYQQLLIVACFNCLLYVSIAHYWKVYYFAISIMHTYLFSMIPFQRLLGKGFCPSRKQYKSYTIQANDSL